MSIKEKLIYRIFKKTNFFNNEKGFIFSIIIPIYNTEKYLAEAIDSVINQTFDFQKVQIILMDDGSSDSSSEICKEYCEKYPRNIEYFYQENQGVSVARNTSMKYAKGKWINFLDSDDKLESNALEEIFSNLLDFDEDIDVISMPRYQFDAVEGPMSLNHKFKKNRVVNIFEEYDFPRTPVNSSFLRREAAINFKFKKGLFISEDSLFINKLILEKCKFGVVGTTRYLYRKRFEENSLINTKKFEKSYFNPRMEIYFKELIRYSMEKYGSVLKYIQSVLMYDLQWLFLENTQDGILDEREMKEYYKNIHDVIQHVDDEIILSQKLNKFQKYHILSFKNGKDSFDIEKWDKDLILYYGKKEFDKLSNHKIKITDLKKEGNSINLKCSFGFYPWDNFRITAYRNDEALDLNLFKEESTISTSQIIAKRYFYEMKFDLRDSENRIHFDMEIDSNKYPMKLNFPNHDENIILDKYTLVIYHNE